MPAQALGMTAGASLLDLLILPQAFRFRAKIPLLLTQAIILSKTVHSSYGHWLHFFGGARTARALLLVGRIHSFAGAVYFDSLFDDCDDSRHLQKRIVILSQFVTFKMDGAFQC